MPRPITIEVKELQMEDLPEWARHPKTLELCRENLAYRCAVFSAKTEQAQEQVTADGVTIQTS